jgi:hypothetical protein
VIGSADEELIRFIKKDRSIWISIQRRILPSDLRKYGGEYRFALRSSDAPEEDFINNKRIPNHRVIPTQAIWDVQVLGGHSAE